MKNLKKILALVIVTAVITTMAFTAYAASITINSLAPSGASDKTQYTWYKIFDASIDPSGTPIVNLSGTTTNASGTKVAYYTTASGTIPALSGTGLFNITKDATKDKWYIELKDSSTDAETIAAALNAIKSVFASDTFSQSSGTAVADDLDPGYYLVVSTLGDKLVLQTLSDVTINTKNKYPTPGKTISGTDASVEIGKPIYYTLTVQVPPTANDKIELVDTMSKGLTYSGTKSTNLEFSGTPSLTSGTSGSSVLTYVFNADTVKAFTSGATADKTITVVVECYLNGDVEIDKSIPNELTLNYGNNYTSTIVIVNTSTTHFDFDKVDGADSGTKLPGAEFMLTTDGTSGTAIDLVEVVAGKTYRIAAPGDSGTTKTIVTDGNKITVNGLDGDITYKLLETKAPTGYNKLEAAIDVKPSGSVFPYQAVENNRGSVLPSTGGIGTTIFYVIGAVLVIGTGVVLVTRRRMGNAD